MFDSICFEVFACSVIVFVLIICMKHCSDKDIDENDEIERETPLHIACENGSLEVVKYLYETLL